MSGRRGEIDVAFAIDGARFILEAKWEQDPAGYGPMARLRGRITQRLAGTRGVLLSMSGYSDESLEGIVRVQQPDMLLLDRTHLEALLSGLLSPADLFTELTDRASYRGEIRVPLTDLLVPKDQPAPPVLGPGSPDGSVPVVTETAPGVRGDVVLHGTQPQETVMDGIAVDRDGRLPFALCPVVCHLVHTARVITAAAAIMIAVFITFVLTGQIRSL